MKVRVVTPIKDEEILLPIFLKHYSRFCDSIVLCDNGSTDRTLDIAKSNAKVEIRSFESPGFDTHAVWKVLGDVKTESEGVFDWCLFPDCDEFLVAKNAGCEREIFEKSKAEVLRPTGYNLVGMPGEAPFDPKIDILKQRRHGYFSAVYSKPIVSRPQARYTWGAGRHAIQSGTVVLENCPDLLLVHADTIDFDFWLRRKMRPISDVDRSRKWGTGRWARPREDYDAIWLEEQSKAVDLDKELPPSLFPEEASFPKES